MLGAGLQQDPVTSRGSLQNSAGSVQHYGDERREASAEKDQGSADIKKQQTLRAAIHAHNKDPYTKASYKQIEVGNDKLLKQMGAIHQGKQLNVASHSLRPEDCIIKSLNFVRKRKEAVAMDNNNQRLLD